MANPFDYRFIEPLTTDAVVRGSSIFCRFTCPVTGRSVSASAEILPATAARAEKPGGQVVTGFRRSLAVALGALLGAGGRAEEPVSASAASASPEETERADRERAIARAFRSVSSLFRWDGEGQRWIATDAGRDTATAFESRLMVHPLGGTGDLMPALRMLNAVVAADGEIDADERAFLDRFASALGVEPEAIVEPPPPSSAEVAAIAPSRRESVLMVCWAAALCNGKVGEAQTALLDEYGSALGISAERSAELKRAAQDYLLEKTLEEAFADFALSLEEEDRVVRLGASLGLSVEQTQDAVRRFRRRRGFE